MLPGCFHAAFYRGDGHFTNNGFMAYSRQFVIDLGPVDLSIPGKYKYTLAGLPHARFNVGIRVGEAKKNEWDIRPDYPASVRMQLLTPEGETVILEQGSLNSWVRSFGALDNFSELYRTGEAIDIPLAGGGTQGKRFGLKASGGWGTYFDAEINETYLLNFEVLTSEPSMRRPARLIVVGWGR